MSRTFLNQGTADFLGFEIEATYRAADNFRIRGTFNVAKAEYTDFCSIWSVSTLNLPPDRTAASGETAFDCAVVNANEVVRQPKMTFSLSPSYTTPLGSSGWESSTRLDLRHTGANFIDDANIAKLPAVNVVNISSAFQNETFNIRLYVNNLFEEGHPRNIRVPVGLQLACWWRGRQHPHGSSNRPRDRTKSKSRYLARLKITIVANSQ